MLKITKSRETRAEFFVEVNGEERLVKTTVAYTNHEGVSTITENLHELELYAKNRRSMRKHEQEFQDVIYAIEDAMVDELEAATDTE